VLFTIVAYKKAKNF